MTVTYKKRQRIIYAVSAVILFAVSVCLLIKPCMKAFYPLKYENYINEYAQQYDLDKFLVMGIISAESKFDETAQSRKGAKGLMQIKDETFLWCMEKFNIDNQKDKNALNIQIGCAYLNYLMEKYDNNTATALAAYNAGEGNVSKWLEKQSSKDTTLSRIPYPETKDYVKRVDKRLKIYKFLYA